MFESFPSKGKGTKTKHVKTLSIRLLLSSLSFQMLKDDKYHTCLAWGCSLCNQTTTVSYRLVSDSHHQELASSWSTDQQQVYSLLTQNLSTIKNGAGFNFMDPEKAPTTWPHLQAAMGRSTHAGNTHVTHSRKTRRVCKVPAFLQHHTHLKPFACTQARPEQGVCTPGWKGKQHRC